MALDVPPELSRLLLPHGEDVGEPEGPEHEPRLGRYRFLLCDEEAADLVELVVPDDVDVHAPVRPDRPEVEDRSPLRIGHRVEIREHVARDGAVGRDQLPERGEHGFAEDFRPLDLARLVEEPEQIVDISVGQCDGHLPTIRPYGGTYKCGGTRSGRQPTAARIFASAAFSAGETPFAAAASDSATTRRSARYAGMASGAFAPRAATPACQTPGGLRPAPSGAVARPETR